MNQTTDKEMLTPNDYQFALDAQSACNLSGIVFSFAIVMKKICNEAKANGYDTNWRNTHPIARLYSEQIAFLSNSGSVMSYMQAHDECERIAKELKEIVNENY